MVKNSEDETAVTSSKNTLNLLLNAFNFPQRFPGEIIDALIFYHCRVTEETSINAQRLVKYIDAADLPVPSEKDLA